MPWDRLIRLPCYNGMGLEDDRDTAYEGQLETDLDEHRSYIGDAPPSTQFESLLDRLEAYVAFCRDRDEKWKERAIYDAHVDAYHSYWLHDGLDSVLTAIHVGRNIRGQITNLMNSKTLLRWRD